MKIVVPIKHVGQLLDGFEILDGTRVDPDFIDFEISEWDTVALAAATSLAASSDAHEVVAVAVADDDADPTLRHAVALGATRAVRVDPGGRSELDVLQVSRLLADVVEREGADLVLCGVQSVDAGAGATASALAGYLGRVRLSSVLELTEVADGLEVRRELPGGVVERRAVPLPAVLAMQSGFYEAGYPTMKAKMAAKRAEIEVLMATDLRSESDLADSRGSTSKGLAVKQSKGSAVALTGSPGDVAVAIRKIVEEALA